MAFHAGSGPSAMIDMSEGNPIRISVQQGFDDPSISPDDAMATQVSAACYSIIHHATNCHLQLRHSCVTHRSA